MKNVKNKKDEPQNLSLGNGVTIKVSMPYEDKVDNLENRISEIEDIIKLVPAGGKPFGTLEEAQLKKKISALEERLFITEEINHKHQNLLSKISDLLIPYRI